MKLSLCLLLLVAVTFMANAPGVEAGWRRRRVWRAVKNYAVQAAVKAGVKYAAGAIAAGKRSLDCTGNITEEEVAQTVADLEAKCSMLPADLSLTRPALDELFDRSDANNDDALTDAELDQFAEEVGTYEDCAELGKAESK